MTAADIIFISLCGVVITGQFLCIGAALYLTHTKSDLMSSHFKSSSYLLTIGVYRRSSLYGRMQLIGNISSILTFPRFFLKRGLASAEDIDSFPLPLKRQLVMLQWSFIGLIIAMILLVIIGKSEILS